MSLSGSLATALILVCSLHVSAADRPDLPQALKGPWRSLKLSHFLKGGDFASFGPCILIQRLPDKRIVLSYAKMEMGSEKPLVPWGFVSEDEVSGMITQTALYWEKAKKEFSAKERIEKLPAAEQAIVKKANRGFGPSEGTMKVQISNVDGGGDAVFVETIEESADDWIRFLTKAAGPKR